jgi:hypothetical protein
VAWTSLLFGASHVLPTLKHYDGNPASGLVADSRKGRWVAVLATMLSTAGACCLFAWLRLRSRSLLAPILAHAASNASVYLAGRWVVRHTAKDGARVAANCKGAVLPPCNPLGKRHAGGGASAAQGRPWSARRTAGCT